MILDQLQVITNLSYDAYGPHTAPSRLQILLHHTSGTMIRGTYWLWPINVLRKINVRCIVCVTGRVKIIRVKKEKISRKIRYVDMISHNDIQENCVYKYEYGIDEVG